MTGPGVLLEVGLVLASVVIGAVSIAAWIPVLAALSIGCLVAAALLERRRPKRRGSIAIKGVGRVELDNVRIRGFETGVDAGEVKARNTTVERKGRGAR